MKHASAHLRLLFAATAFWTFYYLGGLWSDYYQTWHWLPILALGEVVPAVLLFLAGPGMMRSLRTTAWGAAIVCALWWSLPFLFYDWVVLRLYEGQDWSYLWRYWYLTGFTIVPWVVFPALAVRRGARAPPARDENAVAE